MASRYYLGHTKGKKSILREFRASQTTPVTMIFSKADKEEAYPRARVHGQPIKIPKDDEEQHCPDQAAFRPREGRGQTLACPIQRPPSTLVALQSL